MDNGIYVALSRQVSLFEDAAVTANNIANANTTGYGAEHILFNSYLSPEISFGQRDKVSFPTSASNYRNMENGTLTSTGNELDVAIQGSGYFMVDTPLGKRFTRAGNFQINSAGEIVNADGYPVLDSSENHISVPAGTTSIEVGAAGNIKFNGIDSGSIGVFDFANPQLLERVNGRLFKSEVKPQSATNYTVAQGVLESSNVEAVKELTHMITLNRNITDTAQFIAIAFDLESKASNAWAQQ